MSACAGTSCRARKNARKHPARINFIINIYAFSSDEKTFLRDYLGDFCRLLTALFSFRSEKSEKINFFRVIYVFGKQNDDDAIFSIIFKKTR